MLLVNGKQLDHSTALKSPGQIRHGGAQKRRIQTTEITGILSSKKMVLWLFSFGHLKR
jgi:hypothetical protein